MKLSQVKALLPTLDNVKFKLESGTVVPNHFHVTEVGMVSKNFVDCGGGIRTEKNVSFQLWVADDYDHRLKPAKLLSIIELSESKINIEDAEIEVEYQSDSIGKYALAFDGEYFILKNKKTACLDRNQCGIPSKKLEKSKIKLSELQSSSNSSCTPNSGCC